MPGTTLQTTEHLLASLQNNQLRMMGEQTLGEVEHLLASLQSNQLRMMGEQTLGCRETDLLRSWHTNHLALRKVGLHGDQCGLLERGGTTMSLLTVAITHEWRVYLAEPSARRLGSTLFERRARRSSS
jgi:hypothetical protein